MTLLFLPRDFIDKSSGSLIIDVRSEREFNHAHIPGAVNMPLLNNEHRHIIGIEYKRKGREAAVELGFKLVGPKFHEFISGVNSLRKGGEVFIYCWRGGMRSGIMAWVLSMSGAKVNVLKGGYKAFRNFVLNTLSVPHNLLIVGGHTGCGKTEILGELKSSGEHIIDLEALANHRGSAFGNLGLPKQPSNEHFENLLALQWMDLHEGPVWIESESRSIGTVKIPDPVFNQMQSAPMFEVLRPVEIRKQRILKEYGVFTKQELSDCTKKIKKRLGNLRLTEALNALQENRMNDWLDILIEYYDKTYAFSLNERTPVTKIEIDTNADESSAAVAARLKLLYAQNSPKAAT